MLGEQASSPLQTQLADAIRHAENAALITPGVGTGDFVSPLDEQDLAGALVPLVERLIAEAERRTLAQAIDTVAGTPTMRDGEYGVMQISPKGVKDEALRRLAGLAAGPPPQETP